MVLVSFNSWHLLMLYIVGGLSPCTGIKVHAHEKNNAGYDFRLTMKPLGLGDDRWCDEDNMI